jgi:TetR/AcrR family transcriptional regulator, transcriptional repressor for nem operon
MKMNAREKILAAGAEIILRKGFNHTGIQELLNSARIPKGSFYFYFDSKEDFGLELVDYYHRWISESIEAYVKDRGKTPLEQLRLMFEWGFKALAKNDFKGGCPIGNLSLEMADINEKFRIKLDRTIQDIRKRITDQLKRAREEGEIGEDHDVDALSEFLFSSWEGTLMLMKVARSTSPEKIFFDMIFEKILRQPNTSSSIG